ncbi:MAG: hypothetical protein ACLFUO_05490 [Candidatus Woesearchaeota archaeon]
MNFNQGSILAILESIFLLLLITNLILIITLKNKNSKPKFVSAGEALFNILDTLYNLPTNELLNERGVMRIINKNIEVDQSHYGLTHEDFKSLEKQEYIRYWEPNEEERNQPEHEKEIILTAKGFELVETRLNRKITFFALIIAIAALVISFYFNATRILSDATFSPFPKTLISIIATYIVIVIIKKTLDKYFSN